MSEIFIVTQLHYDRMEIIKCFDKLSSASAFLQKTLGMEIEVTMDDQGDYCIYEKDSSQTPYDIFVRRLE